MTNFGSRPQHQGGGGRRGPQDSQPQRAWPDFKLTPNPDEFIASAQEWAVAWIEARVKPAQLRRYYGEVKRIQQLVAAKGEGGWESHKLEFKLLKAKAAYALREKPQERKPVVEFIQKGVDKVKSKTDFDLFVSYFEAVVGFASPELKDQR